MEEKSEEDDNSGLDSSIFGGNVELVTVAPLAVTVAPLAVTVAPLAAKKGEPAEEAVEDSGRAFQGMTANYCFVKDRKK